MQEKHIHYKITASGARIINGLAISKRVSARLEDSSGDGRDDSTLLFLNPSLNKTILLKDIVLDRLTTGYRGDSNIISTKLFWPYDEQAIEHGGETIFWSDSHADNAVRKKLGILDATAPEWKRDKKVLDLLEALPSFDPFLLRDRLELEHFNVAPEYFEISETEWHSIRGFLRAKMAPMVTMAFSTTRNIDQKLDILVDKIWSGKDLDDLTPLILAFRLPIDDTEKILNGWKGIAYFEKQYSENKLRLMQFAEWWRTGATSLDFVSTAEEQELEALQALVRERFKDVWLKTIRIFHDYNTSYERLFGSRQDSAPFIAFIQNSAQHFVTLGTTTTKLYNTVDIWDEFTQRFVRRRLKHQQLMELFFILRDTL